MVIIGHPQNSAVCRVCLLQGLPLSSAGGEILPEPKRRFIAQSLSSSPFHRPEITEILLKGRKTLTHPSIHFLHLLYFLSGRPWHANKTGILLGAIASLAQSTIFIQEDCL